MTLGRAPAANLKVLLPLQDYYFRRRLISLKHQFSHPSQNSSGIIHRAFPPPPQRHHHHRYLITPSSSSRTCRRTTHQLSISAVLKKFVHVAIDSAVKKAHHLAGHERATWTQRATHNDSEHDVAVMDQGTPVDTLTGVLEELYHGHAPIHL